MSTLQSLTAVVALIFAICVIVQAIQEFIKDLLKAKPKAMMQALEQFMGTRLNAADVQKALQDRGLDVTALESFSVADFRHLLDAIPFAQMQVQGLVASATAQEQQIKDNIAASYQGALAVFQKIYAKKNKLIALGLSLAVVLILNANVIILYENISADPAAQQAILEKVKSLPPDSNCTNPDPIICAYQTSQSKITGVLNNEPVLFRTLKYGDDFRKNWLIEILGLLLMGALVSLGAPFWNDVLKGATGLNNALNGNAKKT